MHSKYFSEAELKCKHCGKVKADLVFLRWLDEVRERFGKPLHVSSGYRCPEHNQKVSTTGPNGPHTTGKAVDIRISGPDARDLVNLAVEMGVRGLGIQQKGAHASRFIHLDMLDRIAIWSY